MVTSKHVREGTTLLGAPDRTVGYYLDNSDDLLIQQNSVVSAIQEGVSK